MNEDARRIARLAMMLALATSVHALESMTPIVLGWFRFGFANIIGLTTLLIFGFKNALYVTVGRIFLGGLLSGSIGSPAFFLALSGGVVSICLMGLISFTKRSCISEIGISVVGAVSHNLAQLVMAYLIIVRNESILLLAPIMIIAAVVTGIINGIATRYLTKSLKHRWDIK
ncbi:MAG: Gx transporter family protein [Desulfomonilaceae bacterium]